MGMIGACAQLQHIAWVAGLMTTSRGIPVGLGLVPICRVCRVCRICLSAERAGEDIKRGSFDQVPDFSRAKTNPAYTANPARLVKKSC